MADIIKINVGTLTYDIKDNNAIRDAGTGLSKSGNTLNHSNSVTAKTTAGFNKHTYDAQGHITGSTAVTKKDITDLGIPGSQPTVNDATLTLKAGSNTKTFTANSATNVSFEVTAADLGLSQALVFKGITTTDLTDGATTSPISMSDGSSLTPAVGYVVLTASTVATWPNTEFVWANAKWNKIGDAKSYALSSVTVTGSGALGGGGNLTTNRAITHNAGNAANKTAGLYVISTDGYSHVNSAVAATASDIPGLSGKEDKGYATVGGTQKSLSTHTITIVTDGVTSTFTVLGV